MEEARRMGQGTATAAALENTAILPQNSGGTSPLVG